MAQTWPIKSPQQLLSDYHIAHGTCLTDVGVTINIIDSEKVLLLRKSSAENNYCLPEYRFTPTAGLQESMEFYTFKLLQDFISADVMKNVRFVDIAFDEPLLEEQRTSEDKTLHLSLVVTTMYGRCLTDSWIQRNMPPFDGFDFIDFADLYVFLPHDRLATCGNAIMRHMNHVMRLQATQKVAKKEAPGFKYFCGKTISNGIRQVELRERRSLEKGYLGLLEGDNRVHLLPIAAGDMLVSKKTVER